jgi:hypothetical protein
MPPPTPTVSVAVASPCINITYATPNGSPPPLFAEIWRSDSVLGNIRVATNLPSSIAGLTYADYHVASGLAYVYWCRAYATDGTYTDSTKSAATTLTLGGQACINDTLYPSLYNALIWSEDEEETEDFRITNPSIITTGGTAAASRNSNETKTFLMEYKAALTGTGNSLGANDLIGTAPAITLTSILHRLFTVSGFIRPQELSTQYAALQALFARQSTVCYRDNQGNKWFASFPRMEPKYTPFGYPVKLVLYGVNYSESTSPPLSL